MRKVSLTDLYNHTVTKKYLNRSGIAHAISVSYHAYRLAISRDVNVDLATKAALLHDIGHYEWYRDGKWDYEEYRKNDIHAIKGAERAHKLLIRLGEDGYAAKEIALAILLHTDSYLPDENIKRSPLQQLVATADEMDEEPGGKHHYREIEPKKALLKLNELDTLVDKQLDKQCRNQIG